MKNLRDYLQKTLSWYVYENLHYNLNTTKTRTTQFQNSPESMSLLEVIKLAELINDKQISGLDLLERFQCGFETLTVSDVERLKEIKENAAKI